MATFEEFCKHYGYDPKSEQAQTEYKRYIEQFKLLMKLVN